MLRNVIQKLFPAQYALREVEAAEERERWASTMPLFSLDDALFPGQGITLHLFEPRYRLLVSRVCGPEATVGFSSSAGGCFEVNERGLMRWMRTGGGSGGGVISSSSSSGGSADSTGGSGGGSFHRLSTVSPPASAAAPPATGSAQPLAGAARWGGPTRRFGFMASATYSVGDVGCTAEIVALQPLSNGNFLLHAQGISRFR